MHNTKKSDLISALLLLAREFEKALRSDFALFAQRKMSSMYLGLFLRFYLYITGYESISEKCHHSAV